MTNKVNSYYLILYLYSHHHCTYGGQKTVLMLRRSDVLCMMGTAANVPTSTAHTDFFPVPAEHPIRNDLVPRAHAGRFGVVIVIRRRTSLRQGATLRYSQCPPPAYSIFDIVMPREFTRSA